MAGEARLRWEADITAPENEPLRKRYGKATREPAALFESIGEDLGSPHQEVRERGWWALLVAMPVLTSILHERETREPGWRDRKGKDQQMVNRGEDILSYLHRKFVVEHRFKIRGKNGIDPRPLVNRIARNWREDEQRKRRREVPLDYQALKIPDPAPSPEDTVLENNVYEGWEREFRRFTGSGDELDLLMTALVDDTRLAEVLKSYGIPYGPAQRQRFSRARKQIVALRNHWFSVLFTTSSWIALEGKIPRYSEFKDYSSNPHVYKSLEFYGELAKVVVQPDAYLNRIVKADDGTAVLAARPLTRGLRNAPGWLYLVAAHKEYQATIFMYWAGWEERTLTECSFGYTRQCINKLIYPDRDPYRGMFSYCPLEAYPTELPGLNKALAGLPDEYQAWVICYNTDNKRWDI